MSRIVQTGRLFWKALNRFQSTDTSELLETLFFLLLWGRLKGPGNTWLLCGLFNRSCLLAQDQVFRILLSRERGSRQRKRLFGPTEGCSLGSKTKNVVILELAAKRQWIWSPLVFEVHSVSSKLELLSFVCHCPNKHVRCQWSQNYGTSGNTSQVMKHLRNALEAFPFKMGQLPMSKHRSSHNPWQWHW